MHPFNYKVSLRITHPTMDPDEICATLDLTASFKWKAGSPRMTPKGTKLKGVYDATYCSFELPHSDNIELADFLKECSNNFFPLKKYFQKIDTSGGEIEYFIGWYSEENSGEIFDLALLEKLVALRIKLSIDFYGSEVGRQ